MVSPRDGRICAQTLVNLFQYSLPQPFLSFLPSDSQALVAPISLAFNFTNQSSTAGAPPQRCAKPRSVGLW